MNDIWIWLTLLVPAICSRTSWFLPLCSNSFFSVKECFILQQLWCDHQIAKSLSQLITKYEACSNKKLCRCRGTTHAMHHKYKQEAQLNARGGRPYCPQSHKYNHAVRIWEVDAISRQKIVIPSGIGLAAVLAVGHLSWSVKLCLSLYGKLWTVHC